jgi:hypothetical protein
MRGFHDLLRQKPFSLFILLGWSSILIASLMMRSMYLGLVERMVVLCSWMRCPKLILCSARLTCPDVLDGYVAEAPSTWCPSNVPYAQCSHGVIFHRCKNLKSYTIYDVYIIKHMDKFANAGTCIYNMTYAVEEFNKSR